MQVRDYVNSLPDSYQKHSGSNNYKLLLLEQQLVEEYRNDIRALSDMLDIYTVTGNTLDLYGSIYGEARGTKTDEQYRYAIIQAAVRARSGCDINSIIQTLSAVFRVPYSDFGIVETGYPCEIKITDLPYRVLQEAGLTTEQMHDEIASLLPAGVKLIPLELSGTFEFAATHNEASNTAGFADIDQTIGGYLGHLATDMEV